MKLFRWGGFIGFIVFATILAVIGFLFIDGWTKKAIESAGFGVNGAEVNVAKANLTLSPIGFSLKGVQVADADKPTHNALVIGNAQLDINLPQLFLGNVRIQNLTLADVASNVERKKPARISEEGEADDTSTDNDGESAVAQQVQSIGRSFPEPSSILEAQTVHTRTAVSGAKTTLAASGASIDLAVKNIPNDEDVASYKTRIAEVDRIELDSLENIKKSQALITSLSADLARDKIAVESVKLAINKSISDSQQAIRAATAAPGKDWQQLQEDYPLNKDSALKVAEMLLGESFFQQVEQANYWYGKAKPWLAKLKSDSDESDEPERGRGQFVSFEHPDPTAAFQLDKGLLSFTADGWPWMLQINDLVSTQTSNTKPISMLLQRGQEKDGAFLVAGNLAEVDGKQIDTFTLSGQGIQFADQNINISDAELTWSPTSANVRGEIVSVDNTLSGQVVIDFPTNVFATQGSGSTAGYLQQALTNVTQFSINIDVAGKVKKPTFSVSSTLDNQVSAALQGVVKAEYKAWLDDMKLAINQEAERLIEPLASSFNSQTNKKDEANSKIEAFEQDVEAEIRTLEAKIEREKQALEDKVKAEADAQKKAAEDKLKEEAGKLTDKIKF